MGYALGVAELEWSELELQVEATLCGREGSPGPGAVPRAPGTRRVLLGGTQSPGGGHTDPRRDTLTRHGVEVVLGARLIVAVNVEEGAGFVPGVLGGVAERVGMGAESPLPPRSRPTPPPPPHHGAVP